MCKKLERLNSSIKKQLSYDAENKKEYKLAATAVLKEVAKRLNFQESKVQFNPGGIAVPGDATLMGMWNEEHGVYVSISGTADVMFRSIKHMRDYTGGHNRWLNLNRVDSIESLASILSI